MKQPFCLCPEGRINGRRVDSNPHDCTYVAARNRLIKEAEYAAETAENTTLAHGQPFTKGQWNRAFHAAMNRLAFDQGLTQRPLDRVPLQILPDLPAEA